MLPMKSVIYPAALQGQLNGRLDAALLEQIPGGLLYTAAAKAWKAMRDAASRDGVTLNPTSTADTYRVYDTQERIFRDRYTTDWLIGRPSVLWNGVRWWQKAGTATAAVPGTSNHGWGLAVDVNDVALDGRLQWLTDHADTYGWSGELNTEPWHWHYYAGDSIPAALLEEDDDMTPEQFAAAIGAKFEDDTVKVPLINDDGATFTDYPLAAALTYTHQELKLARLRGN